MTGHVLIHKLNKIKPKLFAARFNIHAGNYGLFMITSITGV